MTSAVAEIAEVLTEGQPLLIVAFGQFAFELYRRALGEEPTHAFGHWTMAELGREFRRRLAPAPGDGPQLLPLVHASIARVAYLEAHIRFCDGPSDPSTNYFALAGAHLADWILECREKFEARAAFLGAAGGRLESTALRRDRSLA